ncbi:MAG TPA: 2-oxoacid:acceptor oxidoreductase family protein [Negativicutes bacterium]|nr:2-oxoacid:acceptor oxidoreductase family protein [Negativicutes bacterium]
MKEIRLHGRGGLGCVKAAEVLVYAAVKAGRYGNSIPFFGFERQGAPVTAFLKISDSPIRAKNRVSNPDIVVVLDPTIMNAVNVFEGIKENAIFIINSKQAVKDIKVPESVKTVAVVDATTISIEILGKSITNTVMLGAFCKVTGLTDMRLVSEKVEELWGKKNVETLEKGFEAVQICNF